MNLSIIIVNYNTSLFTASLVRSIVENTNLINYEVIVVDNQSNDEDKFRLRKIKNIKFIEEQKNIGFGRANNHGIKAAKFNTLLLLNPDIIVRKNSIDKMYIFFSKNQYNFLGAKLLNSNLSPQPSCGLFPTLTNVFKILFLKGENLGLTKFSPKISKKVDWVSAACLMGYKKDFLKIKGFDPQLFMYMEDVDLLYRGMKKGLTCGFYAQANFIHIGAVTTKGIDSVLQVYQGLDYFYKKHYSNFHLKLLRVMMYIKMQMVKLLGNTNLKNQYNKTWEVINK